MSEKRGLQEIIKCPDVKFRDYTPDDYIPEALKCYQKGLRVLTTFLLDDLYDDPSDQYLWAGMQTFHWSFLQCIAACYKKLGNKEECEKYIAEAYRLISVVWKDFGENKDQYMKYFHKYLRDYDLADYITTTLFPSSMTNISLHRARHLRLKLIWAILPRQNATCRSLKTKFVHSEM